MLKYLVCVFAMLSLPLVSEAGCGGTGRAGHVLARIFRPLQSVRANRTAFVAPVAFVAPAVVVAPTTATTTTTTVTSTTKASSQSFVPPPVAGVRVVPQVRYAPQYYYPQLAFPQSACPNGKCPNR